MASWCQHLARKTAKETQPLRDTGRQTVKYPTAEIVRRTSQEIKHGNVKHCRYLASYRYCLRLRTGPRFRRVGALFASVASNACHGSHASGR